MLKKVLIVTLFLLLLPTLCYALIKPFCPPYQIGFQGRIWYPNFPLEGFTVDLLTPENGVVATAQADAAGNYVVKKFLNNCRGTVGSYIQRWSVRASFNALRFAKTCSAWTNFYCCTSQSDIRKCDWN
jgi:hypothetical protein